MARLWRSRRGLPQELATALDLQRGERLLAWSSLVGGGVAAALVTGLRIVTPRGERIAREWMEVDRATWDQNSAMLLVWWVNSGRPTPLEIADDVGNLPEALRERVQSSVLLTVGVPLPGSLTGRVALRRAADGRAAAQTLVPSGVDQDDPQVREALVAAMERLWAEAGEDLRHHAADDAPPPL